jgi:hypothetical protein
VLPTPRTRERRTWATSIIVGATVAVLVGASSVVIGSEKDVAHADTSSAVTLTAAATDPDIADAPLPDLAVTVSQTTDLVAQGLTVSWKGGKPSTQPSTDNGGTNFLQVMQCWGDDPTVPAGAAAQPDRTTCQYGSFLTAGATRDNFVSDANVAPQDAQYTAPGRGFANPTYTSIPFLPPKDKLVASVVDNKKIDGVDVNTNNYFTAYTSNEVKWAGSGADGSGAIKFEVQTVTQSSGIDCGERIAATDGSVTGKSCWLVVVPRGTEDAGENHIVHSGLFWDAWKHRIAFRIGFKAVGNGCAIGSAEQKVSGSELIAGAVASWQPALCATSGSTYVISTKAESDALKAANDPEKKGALALTSRPMSPTDDTVDNNVYAPIGVSGISIAFAIDRRPKASDSTPEEVVARSNQAFSSLKLTPRLIAKLLTNSYLDSLPGDKKHLGYNGPANPGKNARNLTTDPDFLAVNDPEWQHEALVSPSLADLLLPQGRSDAAWQLWRYVLADKDARDFLGGTPDSWGMIVNPWSSTSAAKNPSGIGAALPTDHFPKADPGEIPASKAGGAINLVTWRPYTNDLDTGGYLTLRGDGQVLGPWDLTKVVASYNKAVRSNPGFQTVLGLTDTASAARYQIVSASLLNSAGAYVAPSSASMSAAAAAMTRTQAQAQVYELDPSGSAAKAAPSAYPLTMPIYAATNPAQNDQDTRNSYAAFITYAATTGQTPGTGVGQLPEGYAPLPAGWSTQALSAAAAIVAGKPAQANDAPAASTPNTRGQAAPPAAEPQSTDPTASGRPALSLTAYQTPKDPDTGAIPSVIPLSLIAGLLAAAAVPIITRIRRRT